MQVKKQTNKKQIKCNLSSACIKSIVDCFNAVYVSYLDV